MKLGYPKFDQNIIKRVNKVLESGRVNYWTGEECKNFEKEFSDYHKVKYSLCVSNGSDCTCKAKVQYSGSTYRVC